MTQGVRSPLETAHRDAGGRFVTFAGWRLPVHYGSILVEARAVRLTSGMFDVSHMGRVRVRGPDAFDVLQGLGTNDLSKIAPGKAQYTVWCNPDGGTIDDLITFWVAEYDFIVVMNASRRAEDLEHLTEHARGKDVTVVDETMDTAMLAVQGPDTRRELEALGAGDLSRMRRFELRRATLEGVSALISCTGYTGEDGVEIICEAGAGARIFETLRERGVVPCGLGARDALRMEMGYPLYGHELGPDISPLEAGLHFAVALEGREFVGRDALAKQASDGPPRRLVGFVCGAPAVPQQGDAVGAGVVTSGGTSVVLDSPIGLAFVPSGEALGEGALCSRGKEIPVTLKPLPLIDRRRPGRSS